MLQLDWRFVYFLSIGVRFVLALSDSYIHPDEHFQTFEPLAGLVLGFSTNPPWEFSFEAPARSMGVLMVFYYPMLWLGAKLDLEPLQIWYLARLQLMVISWVVTDWCLYHMLPTKQERIKAIFFTLTSYVSLVYQSHTFSNLVETVLLVLTVYMINELRFLSSLPSDKYLFREIATYGAGIGVCGAFGVFNRVTFPAFLVFPAYIYLKCCWKWKLLVFLTTLPFAAASYLLVVADTSIYKHIPVWEVLSSPLDLGQYVLAPLNNLIYNSQHANLAQHGLHPFYTHLLVNLPQLMGPGLLFLFYGFKNRYWRTTPFLTAASGIIILSLVPHQELRFLVPLVPLLCCCFDLSALSGESGKTSRTAKFLLQAWLFFNVALGLLMGIFHQGGVVPAVTHLHNDANNLNGVTQVWWRSYSPPTWMMGLQNSTQFISVHDEKPDFTFDKHKQNHIIDAMGSNPERLQKLLASVKQTSSKVYLITPIASFNQHFGAQPHRQVWLTNYHIDLDHLDFSDSASLQPGFGIFELL